MPSSTSRSLSLRPSSSSSSPEATDTLCPVAPGTGSQRSDSGADSRISSFESGFESPVNSRLACSRSDFDASWAERPLMIASSTARSRTISRVTVPMPAEFSVKVPSFNGFVFMGLNHRKRGKAFVCCASSSSGACHDPRAWHGIWKMYCPAFETLDLRRRLRGSASIGEAFFWKQEFGVFSQVWSYIFLQGQKHYLRSWRTLSGVTRRCFFADYPAKSGLA